MRWGDTSLCRGGGGQTGPGHPLVQGAGPVQLTSQKSTEEKKDLYPLIQVTCFQNDILLAESSHYTFVYDDNECSLVILNASPDDSGVYTCTARNLAGSVSCKAELTVHEGKIISPIKKKNPLNSRLGNLILFLLRYALIIVAKSKEDPMDEETFLRKMRRLTDNYDIHNEIGR